MQTTLDILTLIVLTLVFVAVLPISILSGLIVVNLPDNLKGLIEASFDINVKDAEKE